MNMKEVEELAEYVNRQPAEIGRQAPAKELRLWLDGYVDGQNSVLDILIEQARAAQAKEKQQAAVENPHLDDLWTDEEMEGKEDKANICSRLMIVLAHTRAGEKIARIEYRHDSPTADEYAVIYWQHGERQYVNITADSGIAIIKDVCMAIS